MLSNYLLILNIIVLVAMLTYVLAVVVLTLDVLAGVGAVSAGMQQNAEGVYLLNLGPLSFPALGLYFLGHVVVIGIAMVVAFRSSPQRATATTLQEGVQSVELRGGATDR
jgi:hypothetical protein